MPPADGLDPVKTMTELVKLLADNPDNVTISTTPSPDGQTKLLQVRASQREMGRLVGVSGRTARALRIILGNIGIAQGVRYSLDIVQSPESDT